MTEQGASRRTRNPRGEGARLRPQLVEAGVRILESGREELTLRAVAREAGIAAPSVYRHFPDRDALVEAVVADCFTRLDEAVASAGDTVGERCLAYVRFGLDHPGRYRVLFETGLDLPDRGRGDRVFARLAEAVRTHAGVAPGAGEAVATNVWAALHGIVSLRTSRPRHDWPPVEVMVAAVVAAYVR